MKTITMYTFRKTGAPYTLVKMDENEGKAVIKDEAGDLHLIDIGTLKKNYKKTIVEIVEVNDEPKTENNTETKNTALNRHQKLAAKKIHHAYNWILGGLENSVQDGELEEMPPVEEMFNQVYDMVMTEDCGVGFAGGSSRTELRFAGKQFILDRIAAHFKKDGYEVPEELTQVKKKKHTAGERKNIKGDPDQVGQDEVVMKAFTGMTIGVFEITKKTSKTITVKTAKGELRFDAKTGIQLDPNNPKFANRIVL